MSDVLTIAGILALLAAALVLLGLFGLAMIAMNANEEATAWEEAFTCQHSCMNTEPCDRCEERAS